jgi:hypothetical protein
LQPRQVLGAGHAAIHDPDALGQTVALFHLLDDLFDRGHVRAIAGEHPVTHRHPLARYHQAMQTCLQSGL